MIATTTKKNSMIAGAGTNRISSVAGSDLLSATVHPSYNFISTAKLIHSQIPILSKQDIADIAEADRRLADPTETIKPFEEFCHENGF